MSVFRLLIHNSTTILDGNDNRCGKKISNSEKNKGLTNLNIHNPVLESFMPSFLSNFFALNNSIEAYTEKVVVISHAVFKHQLETEEIEFCVLDKDNESLENFYQIQNSP